MRKPGRFLLFICIISALLFLFERTGLASPVRNFGTHRVFSLLSGVSHTVRETTYSVVSPLLSTRRLSQNLSLTITERDYWRGEATRLSSVEEENDFLRRSVGAEENREQLIST